MFIKSLIFVMAQVFSSLTNVLLYKADEKRVMETHMFLAALDENS